jgi:hypothetical protein
MALMAAPASATNMMLKDGFLAGRQGMAGRAGVDNVQLVDGLAPTPSSYATMIAGLALLGIIECRRKARQR